MEIAFIPQWLMRYISKDIIRQSHINILASNLLIITIFLISKGSLLDLSNLLPHFCLFDRLIGIECPACGMTRAFCEISKGNIESACNYNFASLFIAPYFVLQIPLRLIAILNANSQKAIQSSSRQMGNVVFVIMIVSWVVEILAN